MRPVCEAPNPIKAVVIIDVLSASLLLSKPCPVKRYDNLFSSLIAGSEKSVTLGEAAVPETLTPA